MHNLKTITDYAVYLKRDLDARFVRDVARQKWEELWTYASWSWRLRQGQITAVADYTTGSISALTQGQTTVTGSGTSWDGSMVGRHLRPSNSDGSGDVRDYLVTAVASATSLTIADPYEGATISADTDYTIRQRWYTLPPDFDSLSVQKTSDGPVIVAYVSRREFEELMPQANQSGGAYWLVQAGVSTFPLYNTGTVGMAENSTTVTGSGTTFLSARDKGKRFRVLGYGPNVGEFTVTAVNSATEIVIDRAWPEFTKSGLQYEIAGAGEPLVEFWPSPPSNSSILMWYFSKMPPLSRDNQYPQGLRTEYHNVWLNLTLEGLGIPTNKSSAEMLGELMKVDGLNRRVMIPARPYGYDHTYGRSLLPSNYPATWSGRRSY